MLDLVSRARRLNYPQPVAAWRVSRLSENFNDVAAMQFMAQRDHPTIHFGSNAGVPNLRMNGIGEINGRRITRQNNDFAFRGERINFFGIKIDLQRGKK